MEAGTSSRGRWLRAAIARVWPRRVPVVRQHTNIDCGAAALTAVLRFFGIDASLFAIRSALGGGTSGVTIEALVRVARDHGLAARAVAVRPDEVSALTPAAILHWRAQHFVVFERLERRGVRVVDPAFGRRSVGWDQFTAALTGAAIVFEPTDQQRHAAPAWHPRLRLLRELTPLWRQVSSLLLLVLAVHAVTACIPVLTGIVVDRVLVQRNVSLLALLAMAFAAAQLFALLLDYVRALTLTRFRLAFHERLTLRLMTHLVELPFLFFQRQRAGDLQVRLGSATAIRDLLMSTVVASLLDVLMMSVYVTFLIVLQPRLAAIVAALAALRFLLVVLLRRRQRRFLSDSQENQALAQTLQVELIAGIEVVKAMGMEQTMLESWTQVFRKGLIISRDQARLDARFDAGMGVLSAFSAFIVIFHGSQLVLDGSWTVGALIAFSALAAGLVGPLGGVAAAAQWQMIDLHLDRMNEILEQPRDQSVAGVVLEGIGRIELRDVQFRYAPALPPAVAGVSLTIEPGSHVALVGRTGAGKSTIARLIAGLYLPDDGEVRYDGVDSRRVDRRVLRQRLGIVTQDTHLFGRTVRANIALRDEGLPLDRIVDAAKLARIHDEIMALPHGYETELSDRGFSLSGGQRQRLALARALVSRPELLVLDEATSHLDPETERLVLDAIAALRCTIVQITHRAASVRRADLVLVVDRGRIVARGSYRPLDSGTRRSRT